MGIEYREATAPTMSEDGVLDGLVTPFGVETVIGDLKRGGFYEKVNSGAFTKTLQERDIVLIHDHNSGWPLARTSVASGPGSLQLRPDASAGLRAVAKPVDTSVGQDVVKLTKAGVLRGMSFGFEVIKDRWTDDEGRDSNAQVGTHREILEVRLHEVTTTAFPAYPTTQLSARDSVAAARETRDDQAIASVDAVIDETIKLLSGSEDCPVCAQAHDLLMSAGRQIDQHMAENGIPDPDKDEAGAATSDDDEGRDADLDLTIRIALGGIQ